MTFPRVLPREQLSHHFAGFDFSRVESPCQLPLNVTLPFSTGSEFWLLCVAIQLIEMPTSCNFDASRVFLSTRSVASRSASISQKKAELIANSPCKFWTFKHQHLFKYGDDEFVNLRGSRWSSQKTFEIYRRVKYLMTVKLHVFMWWDALRPNSPHKFSPFKAPAFFQTWR